NFYAHLKENNLNIKLVDCSFNTAGYEMAGTIASGFLLRAGDDDFAIIWIGGGLRSALRQQSTDNLLTTIIAASGIPVEEALLAEALEKAVHFGIAETPLPKRLIKLMNAFNEQNDLMLLFEMKRLFSQYRFRYIIDKNTHLGFLIIQETDGPFVAVANITSGRLDTPYVAKADSFTNETIESFVDSGHIYFVLEAAPR
ncbi:hypothetical protein BVX99_02145, partial [bacterium F16]